MFVSQNRRFLFIFIKVSSFNIQVFGNTKYSKEPVKNQIVEILKRYDISTIQVNPCGLSDKLIVNLNLAKNG